MISNKANFFLLEFVNEQLSEKDAIKEELNKSFLVTYAHIQVFKEIKK